VQLEADASEQQILARMGALRAAGMTTRGIADALNQDGFRTRRGTAWRFQYVAQAIRARRDSLHLADGACPSCAA
jgi:Recombinase